LFDNGSFARSEEAKYVNTVISCVDIPLFISFFRHSHSADVIIKVLYE